MQIAPSISPTGCRQPPSLTGLFVPALTVILTLLCACGQTITNSAALPDVGVLDAPPASLPDLAAPEVLAEAPFACPTGTTECLGACVDTTTNSSHCGACGRVCLSGQTCSMGSCVEMTPPPSPRQIAPMSTALTTTQRPTLRWVLAPGTDGARVEVCTTRACTTVEQTLDARGNSVTLTNALSRGVHFWRLRGRRAEVTGSGSSSMWEFWVGARSALVNTSWGTTLDVNGDGFADVVVGAPALSGVTDSRVYMYLGSATGLASVPSTTLTPPDGAQGSFGSSVASAGDVNGDGFGDLVVGAYGGSATGQAYVYLGGATGLASVPATTLAAPAGVGGIFGSSVASAGDVNGDGFADVVIGTFTAAPGTNRAYVYFGSAMGLSNVPTTTLTRPEGAIGSFGHSVASAGDVNADGFADVVVGGGAGSRAYVYLGAATGLGTVASTTLTPPAGVADFQRFGEPVAGAGDVNGDGFADVVLGASSVHFEGLAFVYLGSATGLSNVLATTLRVPAAITGFFGALATGAGDLNGDGFADLAVLEGALGTVYVYLGSATGLASAPATRLSGPDARRLDGSVASAGDVNGDGFVDLVVGTSSRYAENPVTNIAYVYLGRATELASVPATTLTPPDGRWFGSSVASAGDVNRDGFTDVVIGTEGGNEAYVYLGSATGLASVPATTLRAPEDRWFSASVASAGDVNGDGFADVVIGSSGRRSLTDRAYVFLGSAGGLGRAPASVLTAPEAAGNLGYSVGSAGDVNGDGFADVLVGTSSGIFANPETNRVYLYLGSATGLAREPATTLRGSTGDDRGFGASVASAGDVNRDGFADVVVGQFDMICDVGRAYVFLGSATGLARVPATTLTGPAGSGVILGGSVASAGDVNRDGFADVIVGAFRSNRAYVYLGSAAGLASVPAITLTGTEDSRLNSLVASAGDVNRDGFADVLVGAIRASFENPETNLVRVHLGSATGLSSVAAITLLRPAGISGWYGASVASAGDVNGDGFADVVVGSHNGSATGHAYVYLGSATGLGSVPATTLTGPAGARRLFGASVASAREVKGGGHEKLLPC